MALYQDEFPQGVLTPGFLDGLSSNPSALNIAAGGIDPSMLGSTAGVDAGTPKVKGPGLMGRIRQQPGGSKALLAFGASLLSSPNFFQGLGQGALAYQNVLDTEADKLKPQLTKDAQFQYSRDPETGEMTWQRTPVGDFEDDIVTRKLQANLAGIKMRDAGQTERNLTTLDYKDRWDQRDDAFKRDELAYKDRWNTADNDTDISVAKINAQSAWRKALVAAGAGEGVMGKPPPVGIQKQIGDYTSTRDAQTNAQTQLAPLIAAIQNGELSFNAASNLRHKAALATGIGGNDETILYSQFQTSLESLRNALLVANKGVQTDGDAERALSELIAGQGDTKAVLANLQKVYKALGARGSQAQARIDELARQYNADVGNSSPNSGNRSPTATSTGVKWRIVN